jgi:hypothetical protein
VCCACAKSTTRTRPPGESTRRTSPANCWRNGRGRWCSISVLKTTSNCASANGRVSATAFLKDTAASAFRAFEPARAIISGEGSIPDTFPVEPTRCLAAIARLPVPHPTSSTDSPGSRRARSTSFSLKARGLPCVSSQTRRSYLPAQCRTCPVVVGASGVDVVIADVSVDWERVAVKNRQSADVRNGTSRRNRPVTPDRRRNGRKRRCATR